MPSAFFITLTIALAAVHAFQLNLSAAFWAFYAAGLLYQLDRREAVYRETLRDFEEFGHCVSSLEQEYAHQEKLAQQREALIRARRRARSRGSLRVVKEGEKG